MWCHIHMYIGEGSLLTVSITWPHHAKTCKTPDLYQRVGRNVKKCIWTIWCQVIACLQIVSESRATVNFMLFRSLVEIKGLRYCSTGGYHLMGWLISKRGIPILQSIHIYVLNGDSLWSEIFFSGTKQTVASSPVRVHKRIEIMSCSVRLSERKS